MPNPGIIGLDITKLISVVCCSSDAEPGIFGSRRRNVAMPIKPIMSDAPEGGTE